MAADYRSSYRGHRTGAQSVPGQSNTELRAKKPCYNNKDKPKKKGSARGAGKLTGEIVTGIDTIVKVRTENEYTAYWTRAVADRQRLDLATPLKPNGFYHLGV